MTRKASTRSADGSSTRKYFRTMLQRSRRAHPRTACAAVVSSPCVLFMFSCLLLLTAADAAFVPRKSNAAAKVHLTSTLPRKHCRRAAAFVPKASKQQLGEFETLDLTSTSSPSNKEERLVQLIDYSTSDPIGFNQMWEIQKDVVQRQLDRIMVEMKRQKAGEEERGAASESTSQFLSPDEVRSLLRDARTGQGVVAMLASDVRAGRDTVIMLQHKPVYTLGTGSDPGFIKSSSADGEDDNNQSTAVDVVRIERGGEVTYHGPGQLVVYPILDLRGYKQDIHWYMRALEEAILVALNMAGVKGADREDDVTGIWIQGEKVAALGVKVRRWVTMHGLAVNVDRRSLENFEGIVPCGLEGRDVTCINDHLDEPIAVEEFAGYMKKAMEQVFEIKVVE